MSLHTCLELPNQAAIAYSFHMVDNRPPSIVVTKRLWPLVSMQWYSEWCGIVLLHGQGR